MEVYLVGGAVRDMIMGKKPKDKDYVVVGATEQEMLDDGYKRVGEFFPVFLHPVTGYEYALARKEKKRESEDSHTGFDVEIENVSIEEDLLRRDLTINAIARRMYSVEDEVPETLTWFVDPYNGESDIRNKIIRHVSPAFAEDPLRVLRVAKFAARFPDFRIAKETLEIMRQVVQTDGFKNLSVERVYKEMSAALAYEKPSIFFEVLRHVGGLTHFFPELEALIDVPQRPEYHPEGDCWIHTMLVVDSAAKADSPYREEIVFAGLVHDLGKGVTPKEILPKHLGHEDAGIPLVEQFCDRLKVPNDLREAALIVTRNHLRVHRIEEANGSSIVRMFYEFNAFKKPWLVEVLARACEADDMGKNRVVIRQGIILQECFEIVRYVSLKDLKNPNLEGKAIGDEIRAYRVRLLKSRLKEKAAASEMVKQDC